MPAFDVTSFTDRTANRINRMCVGDMAERVAWTFPDREAVVAGEDDAAAYPEHARMTYAEFDDFANQIANAVADQGIDAGARVFTYCRNTTEYFAIQIALAKTEFVAVVGNPMFPNDVIKDIVAETEPAFAIVDSDAYHEDQEVFGGIDVATYVPTGESIDEAVELDAFIADAPTTEPDASVDANDVFELMYTSGTTGPAKGVMVSHQGMYTTCAGNVMRQLRALPPVSDIVGGTFYPLAHIGHCHPLSNLMAKGKTVILRTPTPESIATAVTREEINCINLISPHMLNELNDLLTEHPDAYDLSSLDFVMWGWGALDPAVRDRFHELVHEDVVFAISNGQTECVLDTSFYVDEQEKKYRENCPQTNYVGEPAPMYAVVPVEEDGSVVPTGQEGFYEKAMRSPAAMEGYYGRPEATAEAFRDGWHHSSDAGYVDADGQFVFSGRLRDMIKTGGENVSAERVEGAILTHPAVDEVAVFGLPHERWIEAVTAAVIVKDGESVTAEELLDHCRTESRLGRHEIPKGVIFTDSLPQSVGGKLQKHKLKEQYADYYQ